MSRTLLEAAEVAADALLAVDADPAEAIGALLVALERRGLAPVARAAGPWRWTNEAATHACRTALGLPGAQTAGAVARVRLSPGAPLRWAGLIGHRRAGRAEGYDTPEEAAAAVDAALTSSDEGAPRRVLAPGGLPETA